MNPIQNNLQRYSNQRSVYDICLSISKKTNMPVGRILGMTKGWSMSKLCHGEEVANKDSRLFKNMLYS